MNNDLISRSALLKELDEYNEFAVFDCAAVKDLINNASAISIDWGIDDGDRTVYARSEGGWISVDAALPKYTGLYLVSIDDLVTVANFDGTEFRNRKMLIIRVDAWQILPKSFKTIGDGKND